MIRLATNPTEINNFCQLILQYRLYNHKSIKDGIKSIILEEKLIYAAALGFLNDIPIACAILCEGKFTIQVWVKPKYRRRGIGSELIHELVQLSTDKLVIFCKNDVNKKFWESINDFKGKKISIKS